MRRPLVLVGLVFSLDAYAQPRFASLGDLAGGEFASSAWVYRPMAR